MVDESKDASDSFEKKLIDSHEEFLKTLKDVYYLAVLGSLCIGIAAFTGTEYPLAQTYALTAASLFLVAFINSFFVKIFPSDISVFITYITSGLGILMLFLVVLDFSSHIQMLSGSLSSIFVILGLVIFSQTYYSIIKLVDGKNKYSRILGAAVTFNFVIILLLTSVAMVRNIVLINLFSSNYVTDAVFFINIILLLLFGVLLKKIHD